MTFEAASQPVADQPPAGTWVVHEARQLAAVRHQAAALTRRLRTWAPPTGQPVPVLADVAARVALVVSELVTNGLRHAEPPVTLTMCRQGDGWLLSVGDPSPAAPEPRAPDPVREGGRGLPVVAALSHDAGWTAAAQGKQVWALVCDEPPAELLRALAAAAPADDA